MVARENIATRLVGLVGSAGINGAILALAVYHTWDYADPGAAAAPNLVTFDIAAEASPERAHMAAPPADHNLPRNATPPQRTAEQGTRAPNEVRQHLEPLQGAFEQSGATAAADQARMASEQGGLLAYHDVVRQHVAPFLFYPAATAQRGGIAVVHLELDRDGQVRDAWIERSTGSDALDAAALTAIQRAAPMPPIPAGLPASLELSLPIDFSLAAPRAILRATTR